MNGNIRHIIIKFKSVKSAEWLQVIDAGKLASFV